MFVVSQKTWNNIPYRMAPKYDVQMAVRLSTPKNNNPSSVYNRDEQSFVSMCNDFLMAVESRQFSSVVEEPDTTNPTHLEQPGNVHGMIGYGETENELFMNVTLDFSIPIKPQKNEYVYDENAYVYNKAVEFLRSVLPSKLKMVPQIKTAIIDRVLA